MDTKSIQKIIDEQNIKYIDFRFTDPLGTWHHFSIHIGTFEKEVFEEGIGFDGSSIRCFQNIEASDMILIPDASTAFIDPFFSDPTLVLICDIQDPITGQKYDKDPRYVAKKAEEYVKSSGVGDSIFFGAEAEFFLFSDVRISTEPHNAFFSVDSGEAIWNKSSDENPNLGYKVRNKGGYFPCPPHDTMQDVRSEMVNHMVSIGMKVEYMDAAHHDRVLAMTSHIPQLIAYSIVFTANELEENLKDEIIKYSAAGFRDFTRLAGSDPIMWRDIYSKNKNSVLEMLEKFSEDLITLQKAIRNNDQKFLEDVFSSTRKIRHKIEKIGQAGNFDPTETVNKNKKI